MRGRVLAVCGWSGAGKTTLLESLIPQLRERGLRIGAVKHDAHGITVDRPGKDSDRLFAAGADVCLRGPGEVVWRCHAGETTDLPAVVADLARRTDLVLVEGHKETPLPKIWLHRPHRDVVPEDVCGVIATSAFCDGRPEAVLPIVLDWLRERWDQPTLFGGILIGGSSRRMGRSKHLIEIGGRSLLEIACGALSGHCSRLVLLGAGDVPATSCDLPRLPDVPGIEGPLSGLLAAHRWQPDATWMFAACDQPLINAAACAWLLEQRGPGRWAVMPRRDGRLEPLFALYEPMAAPLLEDLALNGVGTPRRLAEHNTVATPEPPAGMAEAWTNTNTPAEFDNLTNR